MSDAELRPVEAARFKHYRTHHHEVFLEMARRCLRAFNATKEELAQTRGWIWERNHRERKRGRPRKGTQTLGCGLPHPRDSFGDPHWRFRRACISLSDISELRPRMLEQIRLFIADASDIELKALRKTVAKRAGRTRTLREWKRRKLQELRRAATEANKAKLSSVERDWRSERRGRPDALSDGDLLRKSYQVARLRFCGHKTWDEIRELPPVAHSMRKKSRDRGRDMQEGRGRDIQEGLPQRYVTYLQDAIHRTLNPLSEQLTPWPGALQEKRLQWYIESQTGLPFQDDPACCKNIVKALWPHPPLRSYGKKILFPLTTRQE